MPWPLQKLDHGNKAVLFRDTNCHLNSDRFYTFFKNAIVTYLELKTAMYKVDIVNARQILKVKSVMLAKQQAFMESQIVNKVNNGIFSLAGFVSLILIAL